MRSSPRAARVTYELQRGKNQTVHWNIRSAALMLAVAIFAPTASLWAVPAPPSQVRPDLDDVPQLAGTLTDPAATPLQQEEAARRLLERSSPQAKPLLQDLLRSGGPAAQIAIAAALAGDTNPDPAFIPSLNALLGPSPAVNKEAARALANYPNHPEIINDLKAAAGNPKFSELSRAQVVRAMGSLINKELAQYLIDLLNGKNELMRIAAADALEEMTGLRENAQDIARWQQWWEANASKPPEQWRTDLMASRYREILQTRQRYSEMTDELHDLLVEQYGMIGNPDAKKSDAILRYLQSPVPQVRIDGIKLVNGDFTLGHPISGEVRQQLRYMVGDSDRNVRLQVALELKAINDLGAAPALIAQLGQEPDPSVKLLIIQALDESADVRAVPALVKMLNDPSLDAAAAAAVALSNEMGETLRRDKQHPELLKQTVDALQTTLDTRTGNDPVADPLRAGCVAALATLGDPRSQATFEQLLSRPNESDDVRRAALRGLGNLADSRSTALIANWLTDAKPEVRLQAALGLKNLATFAQAEQLYRMVNPADEPDPRVRDAAWNDLKIVLQNGTSAELNDWQNRFKDDPEKHFQVLKALQVALAKDNDKKQLAINSQTIAETLLTDLNRPPDAIDYFQAALDYWQNEGKAEPSQEPKLAALVGGMLDALLKAHRYPDAADFAAKAIAMNPRYQEIVGPKIKNEADRLRKSSDKDSALQLIDAALKMPAEHALDERFQNDLKEIRDK